MNRYSMAVSGKRQINSRPNWYILLAMILLLIIFGVVLWQINNQGIWGKGDRTTVVFNTRPILLVSFDHVNYSLTVISLPSDTYVKAAFGYGDYRLSKIFALDKLEKKNGQLILNTLQDTIGAPVVGYRNFDAKSLYGKPESDFSRDDFLDRRWLLFSPVKSIIANDENLTLFDLLKSLQFVYNVKGSKFTFINLASSGSLVKKKLADGSEATTVDYQKIDTSFKDLLGESEIAADNLRFEVLNNTQQAGLAEGMARIISNMGGHVINIGNSDEKTKKCKIYAGKFYMTYSVKRLDSLFNCLSISGVYPSTRGDVTILVGGH